MLGTRFVFGAVVGGALVYLYDPGSGALRRARLRELWEQNQEPVKAMAAEAAETARQVGRDAAQHMTEIRSRA